MDALQFESICRESGYRVLPKRFTPRGNVLLAEKTIFDPKIHPHPWIETLWSAERGDCQVAQIVRNDFAANRNGVIRTITEEDRIADAMEAAEEFLMCADRGEEIAKATKR